MSIIRQISLAHLADFGRNLRDTLERAGIRDGEQFAVCEACLTARCAVCRTTINGRALAPVLLIAETPNPSATDALTRLRLGNCADRSCSSGYYEFTFIPHPAVDWMQIPVTSPASEQPRQPAAWLWIDAAQAIAETIRRQVTWRVAVAFAILLVLWMVHQWTSGGRIPILREPKTYTGQMPAGAELQPNPDAD
ncbi:MAG: hypothetical protein HY300_05585 [Verrucomicrobia bacterium]|nr:hypothetical protein [Verrucomicrobiota bacterium]